ncbi:hypothetical protein [Streptomyces sp. NPDC058664]|uniref:hypothetical protein n=1 Tax=unclassified Streptomyces TaxID=2593676 RepID=UPI0036528DEE
MAENKEWFSVGSVEFPNREGAFEHAEANASHTDKPVEVYRWTRTVVRRYSRKVTVQAEDVSGLDA